MRKFNKKNIIYIAAGVLVILLVVAWVKYEPQDISYTRFQSMLEQNNIERAVIKDSYVWLYASDGTYRILSYAVDLTALTRAVPTTRESSLVDASFFTTLVLILLIMALFFAAISKIVAKKQASKKQEQSAVSMDVESMFMQNLLPVISNVKFADVAGISDVKLELSEIVDFLKRPNRYREFGIKMPKGVLMVGPPGVGKTLVAKAVAGEANVPFFYQNGASFVQIYVGVGAKRVRELFSQAKAMAPSIVFIDEIDAVGKSRGDGRNDEREATLNQLLTEMDGFTDNSGVIVIAATNRIEMIDDALLRPGRFDRRIFLSLPDLKDRVEILTSYLAGKRANVDVGEIAKMCVGFSGAGLSTLVNEAAISALRRGSIVIERSDFESVTQKVLLGQRRVLSFSEKEKRIQAEYQAAKAVVAHWFEMKFEKISLTADRFVTLEREIESRSEMMTRLKVALAGVVRLEQLYADSFSNAKDDLASAKELAGRMAYEFGMGTSLMAGAIDVAEILSEAKRETAEFLSGMSRQCEVVAAALFERESLQSADVAEILRKIDE